MENMVKKYQQKFRKVKEEMARWEELQSRLVSQFVNASAIIQRLQMIQKIENYGVLRSIEGIQNVVLANQWDSLTMIMLSMSKTLEDFERVVSTIEKIRRDGEQLTAQVTLKQKQQRVGLKPSIAICLEGLKLLADMHRSEYQLKHSVVSGLEKLALEELPRKPSACGDVVPLQRLLVDQPNIPKEEVQNLFDIIFADDM